MSVGAHGRAADAHVTDEEVFDAVDGVLAEGRLQHIGSCAVCDARVRELAAALALVQEVEVPEPSPLFWDELSTRVAAAVREHPGGRTAVPVALSWRRFWQFAVPCFAAVAALVVTVAIGQPPGAVGGRLASPSPRADGESVASWEPGVGLAAILQAGAMDPLELVASMLPDDGDASDVSADSDTFVAGDSIERAVAELSDEERRDLIDVLRRELGGRGA